MDYSERIRTALSIILWIAEDKEKCLGKKNLKTIEEQVALIDGYLKREIELREIEK